MNHHDDPDNWLQIPEFHVKPSEVNFEGFAYPIVGPNLDDDEHTFAEQIRSLVTSLRRLARAEFKTLAALNLAHQEGLEILWPVDSAAAGPTDEGAGRLTAGQTAALRYKISMQSFDAAVSARTRARINESPRWRSQTERQAATSLALGASTLVGWLTGKPFEVQLQSVARMKDGASRGGLKSAETRRKFVRLPPPGELRRQRATLIASGREERDIASILAKLYNCSADHVRKTIKRD